MARARIIGLIGLLTVGGCYEQVEPPPLTGPCARWTTSIEGVRTNDRDASFTRLGGALELRQFWVRRITFSGPLDQDHAFGEVENVSDVVVCAGTSTLRVDGIPFDTAVLWMPAYDDGGESSVACLGPGQRALFRATFGDVLPGGRASTTSSSYSRVEYDFGAVPREDAVPHPLAPELVDVTWSDEAPGDVRAAVTMHMRSAGTIADLSVDLFARDECGSFWQLDAVSVASAGGDFDVNVEVELDDAEAASFELLPFVRFRSP